jgi:hypothetical protein
MTAPNGSAEGCAAGTVCSNGGCVNRCTTGVPCSTGITPCHRGTTTCPTVAGPPGCQSAIDDTNSAGCGQGRTCANGACIACGAPGQTCCGQICNPGSTCRTGTCVADCANDGAICTGRNPNPCMTGRISCANAGACVDSTPSINEGGPCGTTNHVCRAGVCVACGATGQPCCGSTCPGGASLVCQGAGICSACAGGRPCLGQCLANGQFCFGDGSCGAGFVACEGQCVSASNPTRACGAGDCSGRQTCSGATWGACIPSRPLTSEVCNGIDDNCDGSIDNSASCPVNSNKLCRAGGVCECPRPLPPCSAQDLNTCIAFHARSCYRLLNSVGNVHSICDWQLDEPSCTARKINCGADSNSNSGFPTHEDFNLGESCAVPVGPDGRGFACISEVTNLLAAPCSEP